MPALALLLALAVPHAQVRDCRSTIDPRCPMFGDVDGDGRRDRVSISRLNPCRFALVVRTRTRTLRTPLRPFCGKPSEVWPSGFPRVIALRPMNRQPGLEPEVLMWRGASNAGVRFFTARAGRLLPVRIEPEPLTHTHDEWDIGGFAAAFSVHDCLRPHVVGVLSAGSDGKRWTIEAALYRAVDDAFVRVSARRHHARVPPDTSHTWPHVHGDGFEHCGGIVRERA
jgi:hypothetical protein